MAYENDQSLYYAKQVPMQELVTYAGFTPVRRGSVFILKEHDSFVIFPSPYLLTKMSIGVKM